MGVATIVIIIIINIIIIVVAIIVIILLLLLLLFVPIPLLFWIIYIFHIFCFNNSRSQRGQILSFKNSPCGKRGNIFDVKWPFFIADIFLTHMRIMRNERYVYVWCLNMSERTIKPTIRYVRPAKTQISQRIRAVWPES